MSIRGNNSVKVEIDIIPSKKWGGQSLLGAIIHRTKYSKTPLNSVRVLVISSTNTVNKGKQPM